MDVKPLPTPNDRYYIATTKRGDRVVTYQPPNDLYVAGPFTSRDHAQYWVTNRQKRKGVFVLATAAVVWSVAALMAFMS